MFSSHLRLSSISFAVTMKIPAVAKIINSAFMFAYAMAFLKSEKYESHLYGKVLMVKSTYNLVIGYRAVPASRNIRQRNKTMLTTRLKVLVVTVVRDSQQRRPPHPGTLDS